MMFGIKVLSSWLLAFWFSHHWFPPPPLQLLRSAMFVQCLCAVFIIYIFCSVVQFKGTHKSWQNFSDPPRSAFLYHPSGFCPDYLLYIKVQVEQKAQSLMLLVFSAVAPYLSADLWKLLNWLTFKQDFATLAVLKICVESAHLNFGA